MKKIGLAVLTAATIVGTSLVFKNFVNPYETIYKIADGDTFILENNKQVQLKEPLVDKFGRIVALVYVNGKLINETMIKEGYAAYRSEPGSGKEIMKTAHELAKSQKIGIYSSACTDEVPPDPKCAIKGNHDLDRDEYLYLTSDCPYYSAVNIRRFEGDRWFCSESEAKKAGFAISSACGFGTNRTLSP